MQYILPFILYFRRFIVFLKQRAKFNKILLTFQGEKEYILSLFGLSLRSNPKC